MSAGKLDIGHLHIFPSFQFQMDLLMSYCSDSEDMDMDMAPPSPLQPKKLYSDTVKPATPPPVPHVVQLCMYFLSTTL